MPPVARRLGAQIPARGDGGEGTGLRDGLAGGVEPRAGPWPFLLTPSNDQSDSHAVLLSFCLNKGGAKRTGKKNTNRG